jgi:hypothetical protein
MKKEHKKVYFNSFLDYTHGRRGREPPHGNNNHQLGCEIAP